MSRSVTCAAALSFGLFCLGGLYSNPAYAADDCLANPKAVTPQGSHWYYHLERSTGRKCWYLGSQGAKVTSSSATAAIRSSAPAKAETDASSIADDKAAQPLEPSVANARAEMQPSQQDATSASSLSPAPLAPPQASTPAAPIAGSAPTLTSRWPDTSAYKAAASQQTQLVADDAATNSQNPAQPQISPAPAAATQSSDNILTHGAQTAASAITPTRIMLAAAFVLLAIAAIFARSMFRYFSRRTVKVMRRRDIWAQADYAEPPFIPYEDMVTPERRARHQGEPRESVDEIEYLLRRAAQRETRQRHFSS